MTIPDPRCSALFTDQYELAMAQAYFTEGLDERAVFELYFRKLPPQRDYVMAAGLEPLLDSLEQLRFSAAELDWLAAQGGYRDDFLDYLGSFRFSGDVHAVAEGTVAFPNEPLVQVVAPLPEAQLVETLALNQIHLHSVLATKATRVLAAARGRPVVDFGSRRTHGTDAALGLARSSYLAGAAGTSNMLAAMRFGIPGVGTMAHSYVQVHGDELQAFRAFSALYPGTTLLVDTYDTLEGVRRVTALAAERGDSFDVAALRLDSGDLGELSRGARRILDEAGLSTVRIIASGGLDEHKIDALLAAGAPIDSFGVGTDLAVSADAPSIDLSYKLVEYAGEPRMKLSTGKASLPGCKQVFRRFVDGRMSGDVIARADESGIDGTALLETVMSGGRRSAGGRRSLQEARRHAAAQLAALPETLRFPGGGRPYPVTVSDALEALRAATAERVGKR